MAYRKYRKTYRSNKRYRYRGKPKQSNFQRYANMAWKAYKGVRYVTGLVNSEVFKHDVSYNTPIANTGVLIPLTGLAEGNGDDDRTGNSIFVRSVNLQGSLAINGSNNTIVKIALIKDTQQIQDTTPSYTDIYESASINSHLNANTVGRFSVLSSRRYTLNVGQSNQRVISLNKPMRLHIRYNGSTSTDIQRNGLYLAVISNQSSGTAPFCEFDIRVSYHDN